MRALWFIAGIACASLFFCELKAQNSSASNEQRVRLRDLYAPSKQNQKIVDFKIENAEKINILPGPQFLLEAFEKNKNQEVKIYFQNKKGEKTEISATTSDEILKQVNLRIQIEHPDLITLVGDEFTFGHYRREHHFDYSVLNSWIIQPLLISDMVRGLTWNKKTPGHFQKFLSNRCKPLLSALSTYRQPLLLGEAALAMGSQFVAPHYLNQRENDISFSDKRRLLRDQFQIWNQLELQPQETPLREEEKASLLPKMIYYFQDLEWILSPDLSEQFHKTQEKRTRLLQKIVGKKEKDRELIDLMANLDRLDISESEKKKIRNEFEILKADIEKFRWKSERIGLESTQQARDFYYYYLFKNEWDEILNSAMAELITPQKDKPLAFPSRSHGVYDGFKKAAEKSKYLNRNPQKAYEEFTKSYELPINAVDAMVLELGFIKSLPASLQSNYENRMRELERGIRLIQNNEFQEFSSLWLEQIRSQWNQEYQLIIVDGEISRLANLPAP